MLEVTLRSFQARLLTILIIQHAHIRSSGDFVAYTSQCLGHPQGPRRVVYMEGGFAPIGALGRRGLAPRVS